VVGDRLGRGTLALENRTVRGEGGFGFALHAAGTSAGVALEEFRSWFSPWGFGREEVERLLRAESLAGTVELAEGPRGIARLRLTAPGERLLASGGDARASRATA
jgi:hypothetical protein